MKTENTPVLLKSTKPLDKTLLTSCLLLGLTCAMPSLADNKSFTEPLNKFDAVSSTVPKNGDVNPYGVAVVRHSSGDLVANNILVSNFNNAPTSQNPGGEQGTGTTIVQITPDGKLTVFAQIDAAKLPGSCPGGVGLTTALTILRDGWVVVGSLPTSDGTAATAQAGCLLVLDNKGKVVETIADSHINGPWDMTAYENGNHVVLFVTNVLNGTVAAGVDKNGVGNPVNEGTVVRIDLTVEKGDMPRVVSQTVIGSGFGERTDPAALVIGPTGLGLGENGELYVADTLANRIGVIHDALHRKISAGTGDTVFENGPLNGPLGLAIAPDGNILTTNGDDGNIVETSPQGIHVNTVSVDVPAPLGPLGAGSLFGLAISPHKKGVYFVDDQNNMLWLLHKSQ